MVCVLVLIIVWRCLEVLCRPYGRHCRHMGTVNWRINNKYLELGQNLEEDGRHKQAGLLVTSEGPGIHVLPSPGLPHVPLFTSNRS